MRMSASSRECVGAGAAGGAGTEDIVFLAGVKKQPFSRPPNHGSGKGFRVFRMTANRWELLRTPQGWKFKHRSSRQLDGSEGARKILRGALRA